MEITIKQYSNEYAEQCADLEKYLWKGTHQERLDRFHWTYTNCPNFNKSLSVIAVNESDEVVGFRGYFINKFVFDSKVLPIAQSSDTVVSAKARRMGIFKSMNDFSIGFLHQNGVPLILNLSASWAPYHGNKKIYFEDLAPFHSRYRFNLIRLIDHKLFKKSRVEWSSKGDINKTFDGVTYCVSQKVNDSILEQVGNLDDRAGIHSSLEFNNIKWRTSRPNTNYIYLYSLNSEGRLTSFVMLKTKDYYVYDLGLYLTNDIKLFKSLMKLFYKSYKPSIIASWDFASDDKRIKYMKALKFISIPFINKIRNNPPSLLRTLKYSENNMLDWNIEGVDIREISNWSIDKIDLDSF